MIQILLIKSFVVIVINVMKNNSKNFKNKRMHIRNLLNILNTLSTCNKNPTLLYTLVESLIIFIIFFFEKFKLLQMEVLYIRSMSIRTVFKYAIILLIH